MTQMAQMVISPAPPARTRRREPKTLRERLCDLALERWFEWLLMTRLPRRVTSLTGNGDNIEETWNAMVRAGRSNVEHSDGVLSRVLAEEAMGYDWASSIHGIILEYPKDWQFALIGTAMHRSQSEIGQALGIDQRYVSVMLSLVRSRFVPALLMLNSTGRYCEKILGQRP